jgi:hypothetical protein
MKIAKQKNITTVVHVPLPLKILSVLDFPTMNKSISLFGLTATIGNNILGLLIPKGLKSLFNIGPHFDRSLVLVSSFYGI